MMIGYVCKGVPYFVGFKLIAMLVAIVGKLHS